MATRARRVSSVRFPEEPLGPAILRLGFSSPSMLPFAFWCLGYDRAPSSTQYSYPVLLVVEAGEHG
jgi:hypothetical protein